MMAVAGVLAQIPGFYLLGFCLLAGPALSAAQPATRSERLPVSPGERLEVVLGTGEIQISTWEQNVLLVNVLGPSRDVARLRIQRREGTVRVDLPQAGRLELRIPSELNLDVRTGGGTIVIQDRIRGKVLAETGGGEIRVGDVTGDVGLVTGGGSVRAANVDGPAKLVTAGGNVHLESATGEAELTTAGGNIQAGSVGRDLRAETAGGNVTVGDVGGEARISTSGGNIRVKQVSARASLTTAGGEIELQGARGRITARSAGGNIRLEGISGSLEAETAGGNVSVELRPVADGASSIKSAGGDLALHLPSTAQATVEATIQAGRRGRRVTPGNEIYSDFPTATYEKDDSTGRVRATVVIGGGGHRIRMETINGDIHIRRLE